MEQITKEFGEGMNGEELLEAFFRVLGHFYPKFVKWLGNISDPRFPEMIIYRSELLILVGIFLFMFKLGSRRNINFQLSKRELRENLTNWLKMEGVKQKEIDRLAHGDTLEYLLKRVNPRCFSLVITAMINRLIRMRALDKFRLFGQDYLIAIDSTWELTFKSPHCEHCLRRKVGTDKSGQPVYVYYHPVLEAKLVTEGGLAFSVATEFIENIEFNEDDSFEKQKQDCELKAFYRLAPKLKAAFPRLNICLVLDGLYAAKPVFDICQKFHWKYIVTFKEGAMPVVFQEFEALKKLAPKDCARIEQKGISQRYHWVNQIDYEGHGLNVLECAEIEGDRKTRFVWLTNYAIGSSRNYVEIAKGGRCRWKIENQGFNTQKNGGYKLKHAYSLNNTALKNYYFLLQIAHMLNQLMEKGSLLKKKLLKTFGSVRNFTAALLNAFTSKVFNFDAATLGCRIQVRFSLDSS